MISGFRRTAFVLATAVLLIPNAAARSAPPRPIPGITRVLLISIDGLRPDVLLRANAPAIRGLMARGSFTMWARTTASSVTLPSHVSMLTGVPPSEHHIEWNADLPLVHAVYPARPTLLELARNAGYTTAMVAGKSKLSVLAKPQTLDWVFVPDATVVSDDAVADTAVSLIGRHAPQVLFVHLPGVDTAGHNDGWGSDGQLVAVEEADRCIGRLLGAVASRGLLDSTFVLVTADHGGAGKTHGPDDPRSRSIPWIAAGPGIRQSFDLTTSADLDIRTEDTFATICFLLGISVSQPIAGHPVRDIMSDRTESLTPTR